MFSTSERQANDVINSTYKLSRQDQNTVPFVTASQGLAQCISNTASRSMQVQVSMGKRKIILPEFFVQQSVMIFDFELDLYKNKRKGEKCEVCHSSAAYFQSATNMTSV